MANTNIPVIDDQETKKILELYRNIPANKKAVAIAFIQGMDTQKAISEVENNYAVPRYGN